VRWRNLSVVSNTFQSGCRIINRADDPVFHSGGCTANGFRVLHTPLSRGYDQK
jgi:hypothetical protein